MCARDRSETYVEWQQTLIRNSNANVNAGAWWNGESQERIVQGRHVFTKKTCCVFRHWLRRSMAFLLLFICAPVIAPEHN